MSAPKRRPQQPHYQQQQQQYYPQAQQYAQNPNYAQYGATAYQQQQVYYHPQQYPSADPYASASTSPYPQHVQYQNALYHPHAQPYAPPATGVGYQNAAPAAYAQGGYLGAGEYAPAGDLSPNHLTPGSMSSGHSPRPSTGRSRLNTFVFPNQGASPSLESQVAHLSLTGPVASLPNKPLTASRPNSGMAPLPSNSQMASEGGEPRSDISLRYPPLPSLPERCATPPLLRSEPSATSDAKTAKTEAASLDPSVLEYITSLRSTIEAYEKRDDLLRLRTEAVGFQPQHAWSAWQSPDKPAPSDTEAPTNPILGVRLLQRLDKLQRENDELGRLLSSGASLTSPTATATGEVEELHKEVQDCHRLIQAMDKALSGAEARAAASERALEVACRSNSTAIISGKGVTDGVAATETEDKKSSTKNTASRKGPKPNSKSNTGGGKNSTPQQQRSTNSKPNNSTPAKPSSATAKSTQNDKPAPPIAEAKPAKNGATSTAKSR
ncbi:uncharacterized protein SRS1_12611 [Sporisorium reilianum f. sp. reilianum]|uniref:Uncharacterized protein n=1 Tax=Sporisorium reilianum f. sp. reilianum TaxID=72559 RepID=A0A2N8U995_9BASI|nr:uncharacterized protein SRS1_12611 [Sporisorium reilianum f. sp. reilianum]